MDFPMMKLSDDKKDLLEEEMKKISSKYVNQIFKELENKRQQTSIPFLLPRLYREGEFFDI